MKIGLEIHVQLPTKSKMFCSCPTTEAPGPNTHVCPTCLGMPGSRPVLNRKVLEYGIMLAKMLGCKVADTAWFSRKTYFYPDMSKSVQITQYDNPIGEGGVYYLGDKPIRITRIHVEEDPGKTKRTGDLSSLVDYNRSGIPLAEIVTEPDMKTPAEAREFLKSLIEDIRTVLDIPGDGERSIRCDCNISVGKERVEVKNVTGLKNVEKALTYEVVRQSKILKAGGKVDRETRRFDEERGVTISVRKKEFEADYGYIDEPDLGVYHIREMAESIKIRESPQKMAARMAGQYGIDSKMAKQLVNTSVDLAGLFEDVAGKHGTQAAVKWVAGPVSSNWHRHHRQVRGRRDHRHRVRHRDQVPHDRRGPGEGSGGLRRPGQDSLRLPGPEPRDRGRLQEEREGRQQGDRIRYEELWRQVLVVRSGRRRQEDHRIQAMTFTAGVSEGAPAQTPLNQERIIF